MTQATHTPGPWGLFDNSGLTLKRSVTVTISNRKIAFYNGDNFADAHLIAAVPDLLAALEDALYQMEQFSNSETQENDPDLWAAQVNAIAAIAKAKAVQS